MESPIEAAPPPEAPTATYPAVGAGSAPTETLPPALAAGDRCANCGSSLLADQRYCLQCGERRGQARFSALPSAPHGGVVTELPAPRRPGRFSSATTLIAGVGTLLLAMGIGVLIGRSGQSTPSGNSTVRVVNLGGSGGGTASTAPTPSSVATRGGGTSGGSKSRHGKHHAASAAKIVTTVKNLPPPTVTVGAAGHGKGYQNGHFTGHFFGP